MVILVMGRDGVHVCSCVCMHDGDGPLVGKGPLRGQGDKYSLHAVQVRTGKYPACS